MADPVKLLAVGATLVHVQVANTALDSFHNVSLTLARNHVDVGSFWVPNEKPLFACRPFRVIQSILKLYPLVANPIPTSLAPLTERINGVASVVLVPLNVKVGAVPSYTYVFSVHVDILLEVSCTLKEIFSDAPPTIPVT